MPTIKKRVLVSLTTEGERELEKLCSYFEENRSAVINRALILLHFITFKEIKHD